MDDRKLKEAARPILERIRADGERVSPRLRPFLDTIRERLCDPGFNVAALWREHGVRDKSAAAWFHELGTRPGKYISDARMDVAARLLVVTHHPSWCIADLIGVSQRTLQRRFVDRHGQTPEEYRRNGGGTSGRGVDTSGAAALAATADRVRGRSVVFDPGSRGPSVPAILSGRDFEAYQVREKIWPELTGGHLRFEEQRRRVLACRGLSTPAFYELLHRSSREEGRRDRRRGIELAQLALDSLEASAETLGPHYPVLRPQACAWLGNAHRLALDFPAADRAIDEAVEGLERIRDPLTAGIVYLCQGTLRTFQRRHDEAVEIFDLAFEAFEEAGDEAWQIRTLAQQAATLGYAGRYESALETFLKASTMPGAGALPFSGDLPLSIAVTLAYLGRYSEAQPYLDVSSLAQGSRDSAWRRSWAQGRVSHGLGRLAEAEVQYRSAVGMLETLHETFYRSWVLLDLALLLAEKQEHAEVVEICKIIHPVFESRKLYDETLASVRLLGIALSRESVPLDILRGLRSSILQDPLIQTASPLPG